MTKNDFRVYLHNFKEDVKMKAKNALWRISDFVRDNPEATVFMVTLTTGIAKSVIRKKTNNHKTTKERMKSARRYYDPRTGHYWYLKKSPSIGQQLEIERRYRSGESYGQIFMDLGLL